MNLFDHLNKYKIIFFGTSKIAQYCLEELEKNSLFTIQLVISKHPKTPLAEYATQKGYQAIYPSVYNLDILTQLQQYKSDIFVIVDYGKIIPYNIFTIPKKGSYNLHFSLLPKYRGASPVQSAILAGEKTSGISIFQLDEKMDHGDIFAQKSINIDELRADRVFDKMLKLSAPLLSSTLQSILQNETIGKPQNHQKASYCSTFTKEMGKIDPNKIRTSEFINKVNAFFPWPSVFIEDAKLGLIKILQAKKTLINSDNLEFLNTFCVHKGKLFLQLSDGFAEILEIQRSGKKALSGEEFARGMR